MKRSFDWNDAFDSGASPSYAMEYEQFEKAREAKKAISSVGLCTGLSLLGYILFQNGLYGIFYALGFLKNYQVDPFFTAAMDIVFTVLGLFLPFVLFGTIATRKTKKYMKKMSIPQSTEIMNLGRPIGAVDFLLAVVAGLGFCMLANMATAYFSVFMQIFGIELTSPDLAMPEGVGGFLINVLRVSIVAALTEELSLRGYVMGNLRLFGDKFAVIASAIVFALMHGNLIQAPFALIAGFALGYLSIKTGSMWTAIVIHALNNLLSLVVSYSADVLGDDTVNVLYTFVVYGLILAGIISFALLRKRLDTLRLTNESNILDERKKYRAFFLNPAMLLAVGYMLYVTSQYINRG